MKSFFNYGVVVCDKDGNVYHFVGFEEKITAQDLQMVAEEVNNDPIHGFVGRIGKDLYVEIASSKFIDELKKDLKL